jgi:hypothetical protein
MDAHGIEAVETVPASRKLGRDDAVKLVKSAARVVAAKGKRVEEFKPGGKASQQVVGALLGPTGNLRAPCIRAGKTILVGFDESTFEEVLL